MIASLSSFDRTHQCQCNKSAGEEENDEWMSVPVVWVSVLKALN